MDKKHSSKEDSTTSDFVKVKGKHHPCKFTPSPMVGVPMKKEGNIILTPMNRAERRRRGIKLNVKGN